jgi:hypothetical protein
MHGAADVADLCFEHAMRAGIGDHQRRDVGLMRGDLMAQIRELDIALLVATDHHHLVARHGGGGRVRAMRRRRDQADIPLPFAARLVIGANGQQAGIFPLRAGIGLQRHAGKAGYRLQEFTQPEDKLAEAHGLVVGRERMDVGKFRPGDRRHLSAGVQLHRAGAERNHRTVERDVLVFEFFQVTQHRRLGMMRIEHGRLAERALTLQRNRNRISRRNRLCP